MNAPAAPRVKRPCPRCTVDRWPMRTRPDRCEVCGGPLDEARVRVVTRGAEPPAPSLFAIADDTPRGAA